VGILQQFLQLPYLYLWLPGLVFVVVAAGFYWLTRPAPTPAGAATPSPPAVESVKPPEQRGAFRRQGNPVQVHVGSPDNKNDTEIGSVLDRSVGGMKLALFAEMPIGTVISIHPVHADAIVPWIDLEIRSCRPSEEMPGQFDIGCQYVKSPPYSIQLLFG
jgi:hypothetical protein